MERGKERAELRANGLKRLMLELENRRDHLLDELSHKKGEVSAAEAVITRIHEMILDINKEEKSAAELEEDLQKQRADKARHKEENVPKKKAMDKALQGKKNSDPKRTKEVQSRAKKARADNRRKKETSK